MSTEAEHQQPVEQPQKQQEQKKFEKPQAPAAGGEEVENPQQQQQQQQPRKSWADIVAGDKPSHEQQQPQPQPQQQQKQPSDKTQQPQEQQFPTGKAGEAQQGPEQPREKELAHFKETPVEAQLKEQRQLEDIGGAGTAKEMSIEEKCDLIGTVRDEEAERQRQISELETEEEERRARSAKFTRQMQDEELKRLQSSPDEKKAQFLLARKLSATLAKENKLSHREVQRINQVADSNDIDEFRSKILAFPKQQQQEEQPKDSEEERQEEIHDSSREQAGNQQDNERQNRISNAYGLEKTRKELSRRISGMIQQKEPHKETQAEVPVWQETATVHEIDTELAVREEETERQRRLKDEAGFETQRKDTSRRVAEIFKTESSEIKQQAQAKQQKQQEEQKEQIVHDIDAGAASQAEEKERQRRMEDTELSKQRESVAHHVADILKQGAERQIAEQASVPLWQETATVHYSDAELVAQEEEKERQRRLKDESGQEKTRENVAHQVAQAFKQESEPVHDKEKAQIVQEEEKERQARVKDDSGLEQERQEVSHYVAKLFTGAAEPVKPKGSPVAGGGYQLETHEQTREEIKQQEEQEREERMKPSVSADQQEIARKLAQALSQDQGPGEYRNAPHEEATRYPELVVPAPSLLTEESIYGIKEEDLSKVAIPDLDVRIDINEGVAVVEERKIQ